MVRQGIPQPLAGKPEGPVWICAANGSCRTRIGIKTQVYQRWCAPSCPVFQAGCGPPVSAEPGPGEARPGGSIIARTEDNRNRHGSGQFAPVFPAMELCQIVAAHQPNKPAPGIAPTQPVQRIDGIAGAQFTLDRRNPNRRPARRAPGRSEAFGQGCHAGIGLQRIAGRYQPPDFIQPQRIGNAQRNAAMPAMRRIETAAQQPR